MNKLRRMLRQPAFHVLLFFVYLVLICLPFVVFQGGKETVNMFAMDMFFYFFTVWGTVIILLFFIIRSLTSDSPDGAGKIKGDVDV